MTSRKRYSTSGASSLAASSLKCVMSTDSAMAFTADGCIKLMFFGCFTCYVVFALQRGKVAYIVSRQRESTATWQSASTRYRRGLH